MRLKIKYVYKKILTALVSCLITFSMIINPVFYCFADDASFAYDPALIPMFALVSSVCVGTGIIASNATNAANELVNNVINQIKYNEVLKATSDNTYNSPYRVINSNGEPEKPNNNNKNGKWFALGLASALGSAVACEKGMIEDIVYTVNELGGYQAVQGSIGILSANDFKNTANASNVALQLSNISNSCVTQFDQFLHSDFWDDKNFTPDDCYYSVTVDVTSGILASETRYPRIVVELFDKTDVDISYVDVSGQILPYTYTNSYGSLSYYYSSGGNLVLLTNDHVANQIRVYRCDIASRLGNVAFSYSNLGSSLKTNFKPYNNRNTWAYCGYKWMYETPWEFTQNVYNNQYTFNENYPNWDSQQLELLGQQIEALNLGIQNLNNPWDAEQPEIQDGISPAAVIAQILNNWLNPENAPDPEPDPEPDPDPDPEPYPDPVPEPVPDDSYLGEFMLPTTITEKFPFSIPFDIARCLRLFNTNSREAPRWECDLHYGNNTSHIVLDLSVFDDVAALIRPIEFIAFLVGLAYATRYLIKG